MSVGQLPRDMQELLREAQREAVEAQAECKQQAMAAASAHSQLEHVAEQLQAAQLEAAEAQAQCHVHKLALAADKEKLKLQEAECRSLRCQLAGASPGSGGDAAGGTSRALATASLEEENRTNHVVQRLLSSYDLQDSRPRSMDEQMQAALAELREENDALRSRLAEAGVEHEKFQLLQAECRDLRRQLAIAPYEGHVESRGLALQASYEEAIHRLKEEVRDLRSQLALGPSTSCQVSALLETNRWLSEELKKQQLQHDAMKSELEELRDRGPGSAGLSETPLWGNRHPAAEVEALRVEATWATVDLATELADSKMQVAIEGAKRISEATAAQKTQHLLKEALRLSSQEPSKDRQHRRSSISLPVHLATSPRSAMMRKDVEANMHMAAQKAESIASTITTPTTSESPRRGHPAFQVASIASTRTPTSRAQSPFGCSDVSPRRLPPTAALVAAPPKKPAPHHGSSPQLPPWTPSMAFSEQTQIPQSAISISPSSSALSVLSSSSYGGSKRRVQVGPAAPTGQAAMPGFTASDLAAGSPRPAVAVDRCRSAVSCVVASARLEGSARVIEQLRQAQPRRYDTRLSMPNLR